MANAAPTEPEPVVVKKRRSPEAMYGGIVLLSVGGLGLIIGSAVYLSSGLGGLAGSFNGTCGRDCGSTGQSVGIGLMIGGLVTAAIGIPLLVYGVKKVSVPFAGMVGEPGGSGWMWRF